LFNGREPDQDRYDFDFHALDSYGVRLSVNPSPRWALSASYAFLTQPEALHPNENQHRLGASILHTVRLGSQVDWASALVYGANKHVEPSGVAGAWEHSVIAESNLQLDAANSVFARMEYVRKSGEELALPDPLSEQKFDVGTFSLGYIREFAGFQGATLGLGARGAINLIPLALESLYGSRTPSGVAVFLRVRPALLEGAHSMDDGMHRQHEPK
jgi:hypothetical protein